MSSIFRKFFSAGWLSGTAVQNDFLIDYHSHILPGVDDGVRTIEDSLGILQQYEQLGLKELWLTPHVMEDFPNTPDALKKRFEELCDAYTGNIVLHLASENMLDGLFLERLESGDLLPILDSSLLVETSYYNPPNGLFEILESIVDKGYQPILAHPERYVYLSESDYADLQAIGIAFQLNLLSLKGYYGKDAMKKAQFLAKSKAYGYVGSDMHRASQLDAVKKVLSSKEFAKII